MGNSKHPSHVTRISDASTFDEVCTLCGATDVVPGGWGRLAEPCPKAALAASRFEYHTTRGVGTVPKFASVSAPAAVAWVRQWVALHQERRPMRLLKIVEIIEEDPDVPTAV